MGEPGIDEIAGELYLVPPARFVATRDELVRQARAAGEVALAEQLRVLRRPTLSAWLVNVLNRHERARMQRLSELGRELRRAQTGLDGTQLRRLSAQRAQLLADLVRRARRHAAEEDLRPSDAVFAEVEGTLQAALVDLAASATVLSGRLVRPMSHSGFGPMPHVDTASSRRAKPVPEPAADRSPAPRSSGAGQGPAGAPPAGSRPASSPPPEPPVETPVELTPVPSPAAGEGRFRDGEHEWAYWPVETGRETSREPERRADAPTETAGRRRDAGRSADPTRRPEAVPGGLASAASAQVRSLDEARRRQRAPARAEPASEPVDLGRAGTVRRAEAALAAAESAHWQREYELADAEAALEAARDRLEWLDSQRMEARREKVSAEQRLAEARSAQRSAVRAVAEARRALDAAESSTGDTSPES